NRTSPQPFRLKAAGIGPVWVSVCGRDIAVSFVRVYHEAFARFRRKRLPGGVHPMPTTRKCRTSEARSRRVTWGNAHMNLCGPVRQAVIFGKRRSLPEERKHER